MVGEDAEEKDKYKQNLESLGGLNIPNNEVSEDIKHLPLLT